MEMKCQAAAAAAGVNLELNWDARLGMPTSGAPPRHSQLTLGSARTLEDAL